MGTSWYGAWLLGWPLAYLISSYILAFLVFSVSEQWLWGARSRSTFQSLLRWLYCLVLAFVTVIFAYALLQVIDRSGFPDDFKSSSLASFVWRVLKITVLPWCEGRPVDPWIQSQCGVEDNDLGDLKVFQIYPPLIVAIMFSSVIFISPVINALYVGALGIGRCHSLLSQKWGFRNDLMAKNPVLYAGIVLIIAFVFLFVASTCLQLMFSMYIEMSRLKRRVHV